MLIRTSLTFQCVTSKRADGRRSHHKGSTKDACTTFAEVNPCYSCYLFKCPIDQLCLEISPEEVVTGALELLGERNALAGSLVLEARPIGQPEVADA